MATDTGAPIYDAIYDITHHQTQVEPCLSLSRAPVHPPLYRLLRFPPRTSWFERKEKKRKEKTVELGVGWREMSAAWGGAPGGVPKPQFLFLLSPPKYFYLQSDCPLFI